MYSNLIGCACRYIQMNVWKKSLRPRNPRQYITAKTCLSSTAGREWIISTDEKYPSSEVYGQPLNLDPVYLKKKVGHQYFPSFFTLYLTDIKHLLVFLAPDIIFIGQLEKDIGDAQAESNIFLQLTNKYHIKCEEDQ